MTLNLDVQLLKVIPTSASSTPTQTAPHTASPTSGSGTITHAQNPRSVFSLLFHRSKSSQGTGFPPGPPPQHQPSHPSFSNHFLMLSPISTLALLPIHRSPRGRHCVLSQVSLDWVTPRHTEDRARCLLWPRLALPTSPHSLPSCSPSSPLASLSENFAAPGLLHKQFCHLNGSSLATKSQLKCHSSETPS